jgi:hypothetical protein
MFWAQIVGNPPIARDPARPADSLSEQVCGERSLLPVLFFQWCRCFGVVRPRNLLILPVHRFLRFTMGAEINVAYARGYFQK